MAAFTGRRLPNRFAFCLALSLILLGACARKGARLASATPVAGIPVLDPVVAERAPWEKGADKAAEEPGGSVEFYLQKRAIDGQADLPADRYLVEREHVARMRGISIASGRFSGGKTAAAERQISLGAWRELGPTNIAGRARALVFHPQFDTTMYLGAASGGVWKTTDAGQNWEPIGDMLPNMAVNALALDPTSPDTLYAGTGEGFGNIDAVRGAGIFKSVDAGKTWQPLAATRNNTAFQVVNKLVISTASPNRIYAATNLGVFRSTDAGETWTMALERNAPFDGCQDLVLRPNQANDYFYAACGRRSTPTTIFRNRAAEGDAAWEAVLTNENMARSAIAIAPSNPDIVYVLASSREEGNYRDGLLAVYRSGASGDKDSWETRAGNKDEKRMNTALLSNPVRLFNDVCSGTGAILYRNQGWYNIAIAVDPTNPDRVFAGGIDIMKSEDGGANWGLASYWWAPATNSAYAHADHHLILFHPRYDGQANRSVYFLNDGGLHRTDNADAVVGMQPGDACTTGGTRMRFVELSRGMTTSQFYHGLPFPGGSAYLGGKQDNGTTRGSAAQGKLWGRLSGGDGGYVAFAPDDPNRVYVETTGLSLLRATNGLSFSGAITGITEATGNFLFITPFRMDPNQSKRLYIGGRALWRTDDGADNWKRVSGEIPLGNISAMAIAPGNPDRVVFGTTTGRVYRSNTATTDNEDSEWPYEFARTNGYVSSLEFDPNNQDIVYATISTFNNSTGEGHLFRSTDGGGSWVRWEGSGDSGLPDLPAHSIAIDPANSRNVYVGTDAGIFASLDGGSSWAKEDSGFVNTVVEALSIARENNVSTLYAFTHGRGAWSVTLNGEQAAACSFVLGPVAPVNAFGGLVKTNLETGTDCSWSILPNSSWARAMTAAGKGPGELSLQFSVNTATVQRSTSILAGDRGLNVVQSAARSVANHGSADAAFVLTSLPFVGSSTTLGFPAPNPETSPVHSCTDSVDSRGNWFRLVAPYTGPLYISAFTTGAQAAIRGNVITVYEGGATREQEKACEKSAAQPQLRFDIEEGKTYLIQVSGIGTANAGGTQILLVGRIE